MMNITKFTQKSVEILNSLEKIAYDFGAQEIVQEHLLYGMLTIEDSLLKKRCFSGSGGGAGQKAAAGERWTGLYR